MQNLVFIKLAAMVSALGLNTGEWKNPSNNMVAEVQKLADAMADVGQPGLADKVQKSIDQGFQRIQILAKSNDRDAQYAAGYFFQQDIEMAGLDRAMEYYKKAADQGQVEAMNRYGFLLAGSSKDPLKQFEGLGLMEKAAHAGSNAARRNLAQMYLKGLDGLPRNPSAAAKQLLSAAENKDGAAAFALSQFYQGLGGADKRNDEEAWRWLHQAAEWGDAAALDPFYNLLSRGGKIGNKEISQDEGAAVNLIRGLAEAGNPAGRREMAMLEETGGPGVPMDVKKALADYRLAAQGNDATAQYRLAVIYDYAPASAWGVTGGLLQPEETTLSLYKLAARNHVSKAAFRAGQFYEIGRGVKPDRRKAFLYYIAAAEAGETEAMQKVGDFYLEGNPLTHATDPKAAAAWYDRFASADTPEALLYSALVLKTGALGGPASVSESVPYFEQASRLALARAASVQGKTVDVAHYQSVAQEAHMNLAVLHAQGAAKNGTNAAPDWSQAYVNYSLASHLSGGQTAEAVALASDAQRRLSVPARAAADTLLVRMRAASDKLGTGEITPAQAQKTDHEDFVRYPHMAMVGGEKPLQENMTFQLDVFIDNHAPPAGEANVEKWSPPSAGLLPEKTTVHVWLEPSPPFQIETNHQTIVMERDKAQSTHAKFSVVVPPGSKAMFDGARIRALFFADSIQWGALVRRWGKDGTSLGEQGTVSGNVDEKEADLSVFINKASDGAYYCRVHTPLLKDKRLDQDEAWPVDLKNSLDVVRTQLAPLETPNTGDQASQAAQTADKKRALNRAGNTLWSKAPDNFQYIYWKLLDLQDKDKDKVFKTIYITSSEPYFPWEILVPNRDGDVYAPLGQQFSIGRWLVCGDKFGVEDKSTPDKSTIPSGNRPPAEIPIGSSNVIAGYILNSTNPKDQEKVKRVNALVDDENKDVRAVFQADDKNEKLLRPASVAEFEKMIHDHPADLLHIIAHGAAHVDKGNSQIIAITENDNIEPGFLWDTEFMPLFKKGHRPFVFLNVCQMGQQEASIGNVGGFPAEFINRDAGAIVAPLWSVENSAASHAAEIFYREAGANPETPYADIVRDIRRHYYSNSDDDVSYAAYCFYGHPLSVRQRSLPPITVIASNAPPPQAPARTVKQPK